jgi:predicted RNA-binding Zn ribbon-like protein
MGGRLQARCEQGNRYIGLVVNASQLDSQAAAGELEQVRTLLNSWLIPNDTRQPTDHFADLAREHAWPQRDVRVIRELRDDLRRMVERRGPAGQQEPADDCLNRWIARLGVRVTVADSKVTYSHDAGPAGEFLVTVIGALATGAWSRLKACPDCRWVFYDHSRNGSKRWCLMYAGGPAGRACGTIAKVRRYRSNQAAASATP